MNENIIWGGAGVLLALIGAAIISTEIQHALSAGEPLVLAYGVAVVIATLITVLIIAPSFRSEPEPAAHD